MQTSITFTTTEKPIFSLFLLEKLGKTDFTPGQPLCNKWAIQQLTQSLNLCYALGELEHENGWDPYLTINFFNPETKSIQQLETASGYWELKLQGDNLLIQDDPYKFSNGSEFHSIPIADIRSIQVSS